MSSPADWYPDPSRPGRLRYWDGTGWSEWVSEAGETSPDPLANPLSYPPPAPANGGPTPAAPSRARPAAGSLATADVLARAGIGLAAIAGVIAVVSLGKVLVRQPTVLFEDSARVSEVGGGVWTAAGGAVLLALGAALPWLWARFAGVGLAGLMTLSLGFSVIGARTSDRFLESGPDVTLGPGGVVLVVATFTALAGTALALVGMVLLAGAMRRGRTWPGLGIASLVLGIVGIIVPVCQPLAVSFGAFGMGGFGDRTERTENGRGMALSGFVLGLCGLALWWLIITLAVFLAQPSASGE